MTTPRLGTEHFRNRILTKTRPNFFKTMDGNMYKKDNKENSEDADIYIAGNF